MKRYLEKAILNDLEHKVVLLTGPRQAGKTTLSRQLYDAFDYLNYDVVEDRITLKSKQWDRKKSLIIFDELHKQKNWKQWLKGVYDKEGVRPRLLVTGSAKLDTYRKVGDSLAGRYFQFRLHPLDLWEVQQLSTMKPEDAFEVLWRCGGYPEPFLNGSEQFYHRWRRSHADIILRQDLIDLYAIRDIKAIETLVELLKERVGSPVSYASLGRDLERDINTIKRWLQMLENLYLIFRVVPYHKNVARALLKEPKFYFYDHACVRNNPGAQLENIVACSLLKQIHHLEDMYGLKASLHYLRTKEGKEVDFLVVVEGKPTHLIEVKLSDGKPSKQFTHFDNFFQDFDIEKIQLVKTLDREKTTRSGISVRELIPWLARGELIQWGARED